jgi:polysaccharide biosynthesis/export protein
VVCALQFFAFRRKAAEVLGASVRLLAFGVALSSLNACSSLPSSGPTANEIEKGRLDPNSLGFNIIDIAAAPQAVAMGDANGSTASLAHLAGRGTSDTVGPGDVLQITVFEIGTSLYSAHGGGVELASNDSSSNSAPAGVAQNLPLLRVDQKGEITLPYLGSLCVTGMSPADIQVAIIKALRGKSQNPQAVVSIREKIWSAVMVTGDAKKPGPIPLALKSDRILDAIAKAEGAAHPTEDMLVRVTRRGQSASVWLDDLSAASLDNIALLPQDQIELLHRPRTFAVFGAAEKVSEIPFGNSRVTLAEAVARAGGPADERADPTAVFVFRFSKTTIDGTPLPGAKPVAYRLDMTRAESYFLAQQFQMHPRDVIYIANARSNQAIKLLQILNLIFQPVYTAKVVAQ